MSRRASATGGVVACLFITACGGGTSSTSAPTDVQRITAVLDTAVTSTDPSICERLLTPELMGRLGGASGCRDAVRSNTATSVEVKDVRVSRNATHATAIVVPSGGAEDGKRYSDTLVARGGEWRISAIRSLGPNP
jgi:hypothetical protein